MFLKPQCSEAALQPPPACVEGLEPSLHGLQPWRRAPKSGAANLPNGSGGVIIFILSLYKRSQGILRVFTIQTYCWVKVKGPLILI